MAGEGAVTWQRALWPAARLDELGSDLRADADAQRAALDEAAAGGGIDGGGGEPLRTSIRSRAATAGSGTEASSKRVYGWSGLVQHALGRPLLDDLAGVHHEHVSAT